MIDALIIFIVFCGFSFLLTAGYIIYCFVLALFDAMIEKIDKIRLPETLDRRVKLTSDKKKK